MAATILLPDNVYKRLVRKSEQLDRSPEKLVVDLVQRYLDETDSQWQADFGELLALVYSMTSAFTSEEIEADISLAASEVKEARRDRRHR